MTKKNNHMRTLTTLLLLAVGMLVQAQNAVVVHQRDGKVAKFLFTEKPVVTYSGSDLLLTTSQTSVQYPIYMLQKIAFDVDGGTVSSVEDVTTDPAAQTLFAFRDGMLTISGGQPGGIVTLYDMKGMKVGQYRLDAQGRVTIPLRNLRKDIYIVNDGHRSFKIL